ncbi:hypothetical protein BDW02DRAFT_156120 [Decorospora gaudefroyi]|uniref:Uncharacterized protein n=1 Tax=Decorospora gaudefroyi TaxID=184978 RepID=A0A6A5KXL7_9PLEO|nr:hypothetical protein BDW02DRAFT_156120 [Decorospora gaudefroyi]
MSDIEKCFTYLQVNLPQWLQDIAGLEEKVTVMQDENTKMAVSESPFGKRPSDSIESIRPGRLDAIAEDAALSRAAQPGSRKRKSLSGSSGRVPGSSRIRPRTMVVVSYDGDVQKSFELLVRAVGTGRNMLRKAKMEARMNELATHAESSEEEEDDDVGDDDAVIPSRINYGARMSAWRARAAARRSGRLGVSSGVETPVELFETTDKIMEQAQELCERAAHVTLRDGDCRKELQGVRKALETLLETAKTEIAKCNTRKSQQQPELQAHETSDTSVSSTEHEGKYRKHAPQASGPVSQAQLETTLPAASHLHSAPPNTLDMEVDDDDDDDEGFVMPPVRLTSRLNRRG